MESEETIRYIENIINATYITATLKDKDGDIIEEGLVNQQVIQDLLDLYNKEKQENNDLKENSIPKEKIKEFVSHLRLLKRHMALNDDERAIFDICIQDTQELLEGK